MSSFEDIKTMLKEKSGKKLTALSVGIFLLLTVIVFFAAFEFCRNNHLEQMYQYLGTVPNIIENRKNELQMRSRIYEEDVLARAELGLKLYTEENDLSDAERLEQVKEAVSADSVSLLDGQGKLLATTGPVSPEENFRACIQELEPYVSHLELYPAISEDGEPTEKSNGKGFILIPVTGDTDHSLVYEYSCDSMLEIYDTLSDWSDELEHMISGGDASAYAKTGDKLAAYQKVEIPPEQTSQLKEDLTDVFEKSSEFKSRWNGRPGKLITLLGDRYLAALMQFPQEGTDILLTDPFSNVIKTGIFIAVSISAIIGWGILLLQIYVFRRLNREKDEKTGKVNLKSLCRTMWPGILTVIAVTFIFSGMLLLLEKRTNATLIAKSQRENVQYEIDWRKTQEGTIRSTFDDIYLSRAQMLANYLIEHPEQQTNAGLKELNRIAGSDYLMRFDSTGQEVAASNSYTDFSVGDNLSEEYRAVLLGYPSAVVGPAPDPYTERIQLGTAVLMTDEDGQPDGFLLVVYSVADLNKELKRMSYENTVNTFAVQKGQIAAAINNENGRFIAHTDPDMIGRKASDFLYDFQPDSSFEGFTKYNWENVYISAKSADGKTLLFIVPERGTSLVQSSIGLPALAIVLILALIYFPSASLLISQAMTEAKGKLRTSSDTESLMMVFIDGYDIFLTLFGLFALIAGANGWWESFSYVYSRQWSNGVHLYSIWAAWLLIVVTYFFEYVIRTVLDLVESRLSIRSRTITRLVKSLITYALIISLFFVILNMFGVNTTALLASAGVISIAVGMGAKSMAEDLLAGFFMMTEGTIHVGDHVKVSSFTGIITDMGIRTTEITTEDGSVVILNNSKVSGVVNMSRKQEQEGEPDNKA